MYVVHEVIERARKDGKKKYLAFLDIEKANTRGNRTDLNEGLINVYYTNSRSLRNKMDLLRGVNAAEKFDIIAITESWMDLNNPAYFLE